VEFCNGKCGKKRKEIIELSEKKIQMDPRGQFEAIISINEQCAHRSDNGYGSPHTRFYFKVQMCEKSIENKATGVTPFFACQSSLIKVVAPGKSKAAATTGKVWGAKKAGAAKGSKPSLKQMMETIFTLISNLDERLQKLESVQGQVQLVSSYPDIKEEIFVKEEYHQQHHQHHHHSQSPVKVEGMSCVYSLESVQQHLPTLNQLASSAEIMINLSQEEEFVTSLSQELANNMPPPTFFDS